MRKHIASFFVLIFCILGIVGCGSSKNYTIKIVVPAGSTADYVYSEEEISPTGHVIKISSGEGLSDTEVILKTVEVIVLSYKVSYGIG